MTTVNYLRSTEKVERAEEILGGPLREVLRERLNEPGETVSSIAKEIDVQKATINYWMAKLSINYARVAHYFDEEVKIVSQETSALIDAVLEAGITEEELDTFNPDDGETLRGLKAKGIPASDIAQMSPSQIVALKRFLGLGLTNEQIDLIVAGNLATLTNLSEKGLSADDLASLTDREIEFIKRARQESIDLEELADIGLEWLELIRDAKKRDVEPSAMAAVDPDSIAVLNRVQARGIDLDQLDDMTEADLSLLKKLRERRQKNPDIYDKIVGGLIRNMLGNMDDTMANFD